MTVKEPIRPIRSKTCPNGANLLCCPCLSTSEQALLRAERLAAQLRALGIEL